MSPGHEVFCQDLLLLAVANHRGIGRQHLLERLGRLARTRLLPEAEHAVDDVHEPHCDAKLREPRDERDGARDPQKHRHEVREVREERNDGRLLLSLWMTFFPKRPWRTAASSEASPTRAVSSSPNTPSMGALRMASSASRSVAATDAGTPEPKLLPMKPLLP